MKPKRSLRRSPKKSPRNVKEKMLAAIAMLLVSTILLTLASFAWLTMSVAPEIRGITTNIGANGSLEIALLTTETRNDLTQIKTSIGQSLENKVTAANNTWGNLVDLSSETYGLSEVVLMPARLNAVAQSNGGYVVNSGMLSVPTYGYDGRIIELSDDTVSAVYKDSSFSYILGVQDYGVRVIGTSSSITAQGSALAMAKSNIATYTNSAKSSAMAAINKNGNGLISILVSHSANATATYDDSDIAVLKSMILALDDSVDYIDLALRQALVAYAASTVANEEIFKFVRDTIMDSDKSLSEVIQSVSGSNNIDENFGSWVSEIEAIQNDLNAASNECNALSGGNYTWAQIRNIMDRLMNLGGVFVNETRFEDMTAEAFSALIGKDFVMTLSPGSGVLADIADFTGDFSSLISAMGSNVEVTTMTTQKPTYLALLASAVDTLKEANGNADGASEIELTTTYGYAIDMAFRCNAALSELLLQTEALQRVYEESYSPSTMGGGSYMEFKSSEDGFTFEQTIQLMDAVRVAFIDDQNTILGIAKLNTSNRITQDDSVKAPLYLYEYSFSEDDENRGALIMGERRKFENTITSLDQNISKAVTILVWLDGDIVDNTMVAAETQTSLTGVLNLQFASSADLIPADNNALLNLSPDKSELKTLIDDNKETYEAGQGMYTTVSWNDYIAAYEYAGAVYENENANESQVYKAAKALTVAKSGLEKIDKKVLGDKIAEVRELVGQTQDIAFYVLYDAKNKSYYRTDEYTNEMKDQSKGAIFRVDYNNNLRDEGNDVKTRIYSDSSWLNLAAAVYDAEMVYQWNNKDASVIDAAVTALETAYDALEFAVFFEPYDCNGALYYRAISDEPDTYGKWYDANMKRVVEDLKIIELDARAVPAEIAVIESNYVADDTLILYPSISLKSYLYPTLDDENEIFAVHWNTGTTFNKTISYAQRSYLGELISQAEALGIDTETLASYKRVYSNAFYYGWATPTEQEAAECIEGLIALIDANDGSADDPIETPAAEMTADQRTVLTLAVQAAKAVEGYNDELNEALNALREAVGKAEEILAQEVGATAEAANEALDELNAELVNNGKTSVTEYNTILHTLPTGSEIFEVVHNADTSLRLKSDGTLGEHEISAVVLTRSGVVLTLKKTVEVYVRASGAGVTHDGELTLESPAGISVSLDQYPGIYGESIKSCTWASLDNEVLTVASAGSNRATITALKNESSAVTVTVETVQGNTYYVRLGIECVSENKFSFYFPAKGIVIYGGDIEIGSTREFKVALWQQNGSGGDSVDGESIDHCDWYSTVNDVITVGASSGRTVTVTAVGLGSACLECRVYTSQGNVYYDYVWITVTESESDS